MSFTENLSQQQRELLKGIAESVASKRDSTLSRTFIVHPYVTPTGKRWFPHKKEITGFFKKEFNFDFEPVTFSKITIEKKPALSIVMPPSSIPEVVKTVDAISFDRYGFACRAPVEWLQAEWKTTCLRVRVTACQEITPKQLDTFFKSFKETRLLKRIYLEASPTIYYEVFFDTVPRALAGYQDVLDEEDDQVLFSIEWPYSGNCESCGEYGHEAKHCWMNAPVVGGAGDNTGGRDNAGKNDNKEKHIGNQDHRQQKQQQHGKQDKAGGQQQKQQTQGKKTSAATSNQQQQQQKANKANEAPQGAKQWVVKPAQGQEKPNTSEQQAEPRERVDPKAGKARLDQPEDQVQEQHGKEKEKQHEKGKNVSAIIGKPQRVLEVTATRAAPDSPKPELYKKYVARTPGNAPAAKK